MVTPPSEPVLFRDLPRKAQRNRALLTAFTIFHVAAVIVGGTSASVQRALRPAFSFYASGLRMTGTWGMFGKAPSSKNIEIEGVSADGTVVVLASSRDRKTKPILDRIADVRLRKLLTKLNTPDDRVKLGPALLGYWCRQNPNSREPLRDGDHFESVRAVLLRESAKAAPSSMEPGSEPGPLARVPRVEILAQSCREAAVIKAPTGDGEGGDL